MKKPLLLLFFLANSIVLFSQNVGIGNASPQGKLHISLGNNEGLLLGNFNDQLGWNGTGTAPQLSIRFAGFRDVVNNFTGAKISAVRTNICCSGLSQGTELAFFTQEITATVAGDGNLSEKMRIGNGGNVGIGVTVPTSKLHVAGDINLTGAIRIGGGPGTSGQVLTSSGGGAMTWTTPTTGTITSISTNNGITGGPITTSGTVGLTGQALALHNMGTNGFFYRNGTTIGARSIAVSGNGISLSNGDGASGNPTISLNIGTGATQVAAGNHTHSAADITSGTLPVTRGGTGAISLTGVIKGNGTSPFSAMNGNAGYITRWSDANTIGNSVIYDNGTNVGVGTTTTSHRLVVNGNTLVEGGLYTQGTASTLYGANASIFANNSNVSGGGIMISDDGGFVDYNDGPVTFVGSTGLRIAGNSGATSSNAYLRINGLSGTGTRPVFAQSDGRLVTTENSIWALMGDFAYSPDDISGASTLSGDDVTADYTMPFSLIIEGTTYNTITISTNGWISFGNPGFSALGNGCIPNSTFSSPTIFPYWDDLVTNGSNIRYFSTGNSPNRAVVVDFECRTFSGSYNVRFQVTIHELSGLINVQYRDEMNPAANGQSATIGFQLAGGSSAKAYPIICDGKILDDNRDNAMGWSIAPVR